MAREKKEKPPKVKKEKAPKVKKEKAPKAKKENKEQEETLLQKLMRQAKVKGAEEEVPEEAAEGQQEQQEKAGGGKRKLILLIAAVVLLLAAVAVVVIFVILPRFSGEKPPEDEPPEESEPVLYDLPESFEVGEETVTGVKPLLPDGVQAEKDVRVCYTYTGMTNPGSETEAYVSTLRGESFSVVDESYVRTDAPDYTTAEGTVLLAKNMEKKAAAAADPSPSVSDSGADAPASDVPEEKDMVLTVELNWAPGTMTVICDQAEGRVTGPAQPETGATPGASMSMWEAQEYLGELDPSVLELEGTSMEDYHIYAIDGAVFVDGQPCMRLNIYSREDGQSNQVAGIYLMSRDGQHLYLLDEKASTVRELKLPPRGSEIGTGDSGIANGDSGTGNGDSGTENGDS